MEQTEIRSGYDRFMSSKQEKLRLALALEGYSLLRTECKNTFCASGENEKDIFEAYRGYLKKRIRPALEQIAQESRADLLADFYRDGILTDQTIPGLMTLSCIRDNPSIWITLLNLTRAYAKRPDGSGNVSPESREAAGRMVLDICYDIPTFDIQNADITAFDMRNTGALTACIPTDNSRLFSESRIGQALYAERLLCYARSVLYGLYPFLDAAVAALPFHAVSRPRFFGTDGTELLYDPAYVIGIFQMDPALLNGLFLHTLLHCVYRHWEIASDQADRQIEQVLTQERRKNAGAAKRIACSREWPDDHSMWPQKEEQDKQKRLSRLWGKIAERVGSGGGRAGSTLLGVGTNAGDSEETITGIKRSNYDYRSFLKSFAVRREEMETDPESFDYIYYTLGLKTYGDMPLIEPLEYKEGHKLEELVIAIDTSGSCSTEMVRRFLEESYQILCEKENFFRKMKVYIIQCDCTIQDVSLITCQEDWNAYCTDLKIHGRSGTNFKPVFMYVDKLIEKGDLKSLKGLIYFTDGNGTYPTWKPVYQTAFVFVKEDLGLEKVPDWALQLHL